MPVIPSLRINGVGVLPANTEVSAGTGAAEAGLGGVLTVSTTSAQTGANTDETDLWTYTLPANTLSTNGYAIRVRAFGTTAANANNKTIRVYLGATQIGSASSVSVGWNSRTWMYDHTIIRTGASAQLNDQTLLVSSNMVDRNITTPAIDTTAAIVIKVTGQNGSANAGDIVFRGAIVEFLRSGS